MHLHKWYQAVLNIYLYKRLNIQSNCVRLRFLTDNLFIKNILFVDFRKLLNIGILGYMYVNSFPYHFRRKRHERDSNNIVDAAGGGSMVRPTVLDLDF
jgi:hypothetical protein